MCEYFQYLNSPEVCYCQFAFLILSSGDLFPSKFNNISVLTILIFSYVYIIYVCLCKFMYAESGGFLELEL